MNDFGKLWAGQTISRLGSEITIFALPTLAVLTLHASPAQLGILGALEVAPFPILGLFVGVWADRLPRRTVLIAADVGRLVVLGSVPIAAAYGMLGMWQVYLVGLCSGICTVFFDVAYQSYLPSLVKRDDLASANAKLELSNSGSRIAGNAVAGILVQSVGAAIAVGLDAVSYLISVLSLSFMRTREERHSGRAFSLRSMRDEIAEGLHLVLRRPDLRSLTLATGLTNFGFAMGNAVTLIYAYRTLHVSPGTLGVLFGISSLGFVGALSASWLRTRFGLRTVLIGALVVAGLSTATILFAQFGAAPLFIVISTALPTIMTVIYNVNQVSYRQASVESRLQGRMSATMKTFVWGTLPVGALAGGFLGGTIGVQATIASGAIISTAAAAFLWNLREREISTSSGELG